VATLVSSIMPPDTALKKRNESGADDPLPVDVQVVKVSFFFKGLSVYLCMETRTWVTRECKYSKKPVLKTEVKNDL
jgi:hypothetical protein